MWKTSANASIGFGSPYRQRENDSSYAYEDVEWAIPLIARDKDQFSLRATMKEEANF